MVQLSHPYMTTEKTIALTRRIFVGQVDFLAISVGKESALNAGDPSLIPGSGISTGEGIGYPPCGSARKESACNVGDLGSIPGLKIPWRRERLPTPVFWPGEFHELYSPWGPKELDTTV